MAIGSNISTKSIFEAIKLYEPTYKIIDVPLIVDEEVSNFTKPSFCKNFYHNDKVYVASAEQSFLQLIHDKKFLDGKYQALTPCYRNEDILDNTHYTVFLKLELISINDTNYEYMTAQAHRVMEMLGVKTTIVKTDIGLDLVANNGVELGSYGTRNYNGIDYVYGTGIAEPRFSYCKKSI